MTPVELHVDYTWILGELWESNYDVRGRKFYLGGNTGFFKAKAPKFTFFR